MKSRTFSAVSAIMILISVLLCGCAVKDNETTEKQVSSDGEKGNEGSDGEAVFPESSDGNEEASGGNTVITPKKENELPFVRKK